MVRMRYAGVPNPKEAFAELAPLRKKLVDMGAHCRPFGPDYLILQAAQKALDTAAFHFTGDPDFFAAKLSSSTFARSD